jgi:hypothetical protein
MTYTNKEQKMRTITTLRNGNIYQMDIQEAIDIVQAYQRVNGLPGLLETAQEMQDLATLDQLPLIQKVAIRRFMKDMQALFAEKETV